MKTIVLASASPRRKKLLDRLQLNFTVIESDEPENFDPADGPPDIVQTLSLQKAKAVASEVEGDTLVIGADTIVTFRGQILEKPKNEEQAASMLASLSGNTHEVFTGVALVKVMGNNNYSECTFYECTTVWFSPISGEEIKSYVQSGSPMDKAGTYGIQDKAGTLFVEKIKGDYYNVVGFPLHAFYQHMKSFTPDYLSSNLLS